MKPELKTSWLAALRSGEYSQTRMMLRDVDSYCCLGVLCDISGGGEWDAGDYVHKDGFRCYSNRVTMHPSTELSYNEASDLSNMNDCDKLSFMEIADVIEEKY